MLRKVNLFIVLAPFLLAACAPAVPVSVATETASALPPIPTKTPTSAVFAALEAAKQTGTPASTPVIATLELQKIETQPDSCSNLPQDLPGEGLTDVAYFPSGYCFHGELDTFDLEGRVYVAQVIMDKFPNGYAAFRIIDVTDVEQPALVGAWKWNIPTYTADIKAFRQGDRRFLAVSRDPNSAITEKLCTLLGGIVIVEVTDPANPELITTLNGKSTGSQKEWCNSHTAQVSLDADGNGAYLYVSATDIFDLRVLDIHDLEHVTEAGHYTHPDAGFYNERNIFFVHDTSITDDRVYVANWSAGLLILDRAAIESGKAAVPLNPLDSIDPPGLHIHQAQPTSDENFVFVEDENRSRPPESHLRMYDIRDLQAPKEVAAIKLDGTFGSPHNMLVVGNRLFVGWYQDGVRVFKYDVSDPENPTVEQDAFKAVRPRFSTNLYSGPFDGVWGVRLHDCQVAGQPRDCIFASDMTYGLIILALEP